MTHRRPMMLVGGREMADAESTPPFPHPFLNHTFNPASSFHHFQSPIHTDIFHNEATFFSDIDLIIRNTCRMGELVAVWMCLEQVLQRGCADVLTCVRLVRSFLPWTADHLVGLVWLYLWWYGMVGFVMVWFGMVRYGVV